MTVSPPIRWRMPPLIRVTLLLHAAALAVFLFAPDAWRWAVAAVIANHAVLTLTGLWPRSTWLGENWIELPPSAAARNEIALTIDDGPDPDVTPRVLDLLDSHGVRATFFCIGKNAERYPDLCRDIVRRGHAVENHSQRHPHYFSLLGLMGLTREVQTAQEALGRITGRRPLFFRAPAGLRNPMLDPVLARLGLRLAAWTRRGFDTRTRDPALVGQRLMRDLRPGAILLVHDGNCARTGAGVPVVLEVLPGLIQAASNAGLRFVTLADALARA